MGLRLIAKTFAPLTDFLSKSLISLISTVDSAQVGLSREKNEDPTMKLKA
jgi:hypothetical protein